MSRLIDDLRHVTAMWDAPRRRVVLVSAARSMLYPQVRAVVWTRIGMWCWRRQLRPLALWCKAHVVAATGAEIHPAAQIGGGFNLVHTVGVVIGRDVVAGRDLVLHQGVTLGDGGRGDGQPVIGNGVRIGAGAVVLGGVVVGDDALIGANAVVLANVAAGTTVVGVWK